MRKTYLLFSFLLTAFLITPVKTGAQIEEDSLSIAQVYNLVVLDSATLNSSDSEGRIAIGGHAFIDYDIGINIPDPSQTNDVLVVNKNLTFTGITNVYDGDVVYGDSLFNEGNVNVPNGSLIQGKPINFKDVALEMAEYSRTWKLIPNNGSVSDTNSGTGLILTGLQPGLNIINVDSSDFAGKTGVYVKAPAGATVVVNIGGIAHSWSGDSEVEGTARTKVIYNFYEATDLNISNISVFGSILAPFAHLEFPSGVIYGNVVVYSVNASGQFNFSPFDGEVEYERSEISSDCEITIKKVLIGTSFKTNPTWFGRNNWWAGTFLGYTNGYSTEFYCVDINHPLQFNDGYSLDEIIEGPIAYIVNNYYPSVPHTGNNGQLKNKNDEAAAIQVAIWHYSDGVNPSYVTKQKIRDRAIEIVNDARGKTQKPVVTFEIAPSSQVQMFNNAHTFTVTAKDADGNPVAGIDVDISAENGTLTPSTGTTDANGNFIFSLAHDGTSTVSEVTATTNLGVIPAASRYYLPGKQTLVTNKPVTTCLSTKASAVWTEDFLPGNDLSFVNYSTSNSDLGSDFITDIYSIGDFIYAGTNANGLAIFNKEFGVWDMVTMEEQEIPFNGITATYAVTYEGYEGDGFAGSSNQGFIYHVEPKDGINEELFHFTSQNSGFNGNGVNDFNSYQFGDSLYIIVASDVGVSFMNLETRTFKNVSLQGEGFPGGAATVLEVDPDGDLWIGTNFGAAYTDDMGATFTYFTADSSDLPGNNISAITSDSSGNVFFGTTHNGLSFYNKSSEEWTQLDQFITSQPVTALEYIAGKLYVGNYDQGLFTFDGENWQHYPSVVPSGRPTIITSFSYDGTDMWVGTQTGVSRSTQGFGDQNGDVTLLIDDAVSTIGNIVAVNFRLEVDGDVSYNDISGTIQFNSSQLRMVGGNIGSLFNNWYLRLQNNEEGIENRFAFRASGPTPITESGNIFQLYFYVSDDLPAAGRSVIYATDFKAGLENPINHDDLGIVTFTNSGTGNAGLGDVTLDGEINLSDMLAIVHHLTYGGEYELTGGALANADVNEDSSVDDLDVADMVFYLHNGMFPDDEKNKNKKLIIRLRDLTINQDDAEVSIPVSVEAEDGLKAFEEYDVRSVQITFTYDSTVLDFETFTSGLVAEGNYVNAVEVEPGIAEFTFASPVGREDGLDLGEITVSFPSGTIQENTTIGTSIRVNGGDETVGPNIVIQTTDVNEEEVIPTEYSLSQNYPNPFNPATTIKYSLPNAGLVQLKIYDVLGREIAELVNTEQNAGVYNVQWNGENSAGAKVSSGVYFYRIEAGDFVQVNKMILLK